MSIKKLATLLLAVVMLLATLAGCGTSDIGGVVTPPESTGTSNIGGSVTPQESTTGKDSATEPTTNDNPLSIGRLVGGTYTNQYIGITCKLDESWTFSSAEELQEIPGQTGEMFEGSELGELLKDMEQIMDMKAESVQELATMNISYQKLTVAQRLAYATNTEEQIIDAVLGQKDLLEDAYATAGITVSSIEKKTVTFAGEKHTAIYTVGETQGIAYFALQVQYHHLGEYSATVTVGSFLTDKTADLLALFYAI